MSFNTNKSKSLQLKINQDKLIKLTLNHKRGDCEGWQLRKIKKKKSSLGSM
jgi:hypothetical protein